MSTLNFKTNIQLKSIIGKDLINDDNIAILELVKNSFDADAKKVDVKYLNLKNNDDKTIETFSDQTSRLIITDNGLGMNLDDIQNKWLNIAYSEKKLNKTQHKRRMAGAKGVGRFSCDRLGEYLNLYSKTINDENYFKLTIDWKKFEVEDENKEIQSIPLEYKKLTKIEFEKLGFTVFKQGVLLEIIKLRSNWVYKNKENDPIKWNTDKFVELKKYLEKLINPNQAFEINDFGIHIDAPEFIVENGLRNEHEKFIGKVENRIFDKLEFKSTSIDSKTLEGGKVILTELKDKGETVYWVKEKNPFYPNIKDVKLVIYFLNSYAKAFFTKQTGIQSVNYGSIFLFINGFRIPPYGDVGNDWLALDQRKAQGTKRYLGSRDIIGHIEISDENNDFQIISSREGIVNNENFNSLTASERNDSYFYKTLRRLERYVVEGLNWDSSIYDSQDKEDSIKLKELESKIIMGSIKEEDLEYREDEHTKKSRVYSTIHALIAAKASEVIELYINEKLITQKIAEEKEASEREFNQLIEDFSNRKIDSEILNKILHKKALENVELEKQLKEFSKYNTNEATTKAILEIQDYKQTIEKQTRLIQGLQEQLEDLKNQKDLAEKSANSYKEKATKAEINLIIEKEKNLYLLATRKTLSEDADELIHSMKLSAIGIEGSIDKIIDEHKEDIFRNKVLFSELIGIREIAERVKKLTMMITKSNFKTDEEEQKVNVAKFVNEYIENYSYAYKGKISITCKGESNFFTRLSILDLTIIIDNLISNSFKARATIIEIQFIDNKSDLEMIFSDNGIGLDLASFPSVESIFDLGVKTKSEGSGIGLYSVRKKIRNMYGDIRFLGNQIALKGATFKLTFK